MSARAALIILGALFISACSNPSFFTPPKMESSRPILDPVWQTKLHWHEFLQYKPQEFAIPTLSKDGEKILIGTSHGDFFALSARNGDVLWQFKAKGPINSRAKVTKKHVFFGSSGGLLYKLSISTGKKIWSYTTKGEILSTPGIAAGRVAFTNSEGTIFVLDEVTGKYLWSFSRGRPDRFSAEGQSSPIIVNNVVYVGFDDGHFSALNLDDGSEIWGRNLGNETKLVHDVDGIPVVDNGQVFASSYSGGVYAMKAKDGEILWHYEVEGAGSCAVEVDYLYVTTSNREIHCLNRRNGHLVWRFRFAISENIILADPNTYNKYLFVSDFQGLAILDRFGGSIKEKYPLSFGLSAGLAIYGDRLFVLGNSGDVFAFDIR
jgi:outer membrane protein assembly factor BamB